MWNPQGPAAGRSAWRSGPCKPMMLTWVTFYIISSREPPPFWKRILDLSKFLEFLNFEKAGLNQKMTIFDKKKVENIFRKFRSNFWEKTFIFLNSKSPSPSNDRVITIKIHSKKFLKNFIKISLIWTFRSNFIYIWYKSYQNFLTNS